jgi:hypothetical protein
LQFNCVLSKAVFAGTSQGAKNESLPACLKLAAEFHASDSFVMRVFTS